MDHQGQEKMTSILNLRKGSSGGYPRDPNGIDSGSGNGLEVGEPTMSKEQERNERVKA